MPERHEAPAASRGGDANQCIRRADLEEKAAYASERANGGEDTHKRQCNQLEIDEKRAGRRDKSGQGGSFQGRMRCCRDLTRSEVLCCSVNVAPSDTTRSLGPTRLCRPYDSHRHDLDHLNVPP
jgi:hypothetical protein